MKREREEEREGERERGRKGRREGGKERGRKGGREGERRTSYIGSQLTPSKSQNSRDNAKQCCTEVALLHSETSAALHLAHCSAQNTAFFLFLEH